jgi:hypothetical protein
MDTHNLHEPMQSAYRSFHSTETALLRVQNDILHAIDTQHCVLLVLLDLSAAFDTVDHGILLNRLSSRFGVTDDALAWFASYLKDRKQSVLIDGSTSEQHILDRNVPQGSVLGPILFTNYTAPVGDIVRSHENDSHLYADDTQLYSSFKPAVPGSTEAAIQKVENCIVDVRAWMAKNALKLNDDKTEFLVIGTRQQLAKLEDKPSIQIGDHTVKPSTSARNIGVIFDSTMSLEKHINTTCSSAWFHLRNIWKIRKYLNNSATETLVHAFVSSKLDQCNSLLYGLPSKQLKKLQRVQNAAARVVTKVRKFDHISPILHSLHWLPVEARI